jgi:hypothetical protein
MPSTNKQKIEELQFRIGSLEKRVSEEVAAILKGAQSLLKRVAALEKK